MSTTPNASAADALAALTAGLTEEKINAMLQVTGHYIVLTTWILL
jgi:hypothetical protein